MEFSVLLFQTLLFQNFNSLRDRYRIFCLFVLSLRPQFAPLNSLYLKEITFFLFLFLFLFLFFFLIILLIFIHPKQYAAAMQF